LASTSDPEMVYARKRQKEAANMLMFISDINHETLEKTTAWDVGIVYLSKAAKADAKCVLKSTSGYIRQSRYQAIAPMYVEYESEAR